jgi:hypothetical protein
MLCRYLSKHKAIIVVPRFSVDQVKTCRVSEGAICIWMQVSFNIPHINIIRDDLPIKHLTRTDDKMFCTPYDLDDQGERQI